VTNTLKQRISKITLGAATAALTLAFVIGLGMVGAPSAQAQTFTLLHSFTGSPDGANPYATVIMDASGNLYGTTGNGGHYGNGTVFKVDTSGTETILHNFSGGWDGYGPSSLTFDASGNLYGSTAYGGGGGCTYGCGVAYKLTPTSGGKWKESVLYVFHNNGKDGINPSSSLVLDTSGALYGTTGQGGGYNLGVVFKLVPSGSGHWKERVLHTFTGRGDGSQPNGPVIFDTLGNLYGTTYSGGAYRQGVVFKLTPTSGGKWPEAVLYNFQNNGSDGQNPVGPIVFDESGNLYGTTEFGGGCQGCGYEGTVFELTPNAHGQWTEQVLHAFSGTPDGRAPTGGVTLDGVGNLYGTTQAGGTSDSGTVFEMTRNQDGSWLENVLYSFTGGTDGQGPYEGVVLDGTGNLYGTAYYGGDNVCQGGCGTVWKLTP
jgi:uncharacterized repeat protein (TIGR03803 family)